MKNKIAFVFTLAVLSVSGLSLGACNTVEGAGQDIEEAGETVEGAAQ